MISSRALARNTVLNVLGQVVPMIAAVIAIPILLHHLGPSRFGVLTLAWAAIGYFSLFDLGLGRALTQAVAVRLDAPERASELPSVAWTALALMLLLGVVGGILLAVLTPWIVHRGLNIPPVLVVETLGAFYLLAASLPFVVTTAGLRGLLEAHQQFGAATALRIPLALFAFVGPLAILPFSTSLISIVTVLVFGRVATWLAHLVVCLGRYHYLRGRIQVSPNVMAPLLRFGGWMTVSAVISPVMAYLDRFLIGAILPLAAVAHYVTPYELVTKLLVVPQAMVVAAFPAFASTYVTDRARTAVFFERTLRAVLLVMFPLLLTVVMFAREGLTLWVGAQFAAPSTAVLQCLAIGVFINAMAQAPYVVLQSTGRPDINAKLHLLELPIYLIALWWFAQRFGIVGVAMAWSGRAALDAVALVFLASRRVPGEPQRMVLTLLTLVGVPAVLGLATLVDDVAVKTVMLVLVLIVFAHLGWTRLVHPAERDGLLQWARGRRGPVISAGE